MFLLKRKSDGKYWRNRSSHSFKHWTRDGNEGEWVENPSLCKPFSSPTAAKNSRGAQIKVPFKRPAADGDWDRFYEQSRKWYARGNLSARNAQFERQYEIISVELKVI